MPEIQIRRMPASATYELRQRVLRPHQTLDEMALPGDDDGDTAHLCALDRSGRVVGTASVRREPPSWDLHSATAWRLRGMATESEVRNLGIGTALLSAVIDHVGALGGGLLWCNARMPAVDFYRRSGFVTRGESWEEPTIGPHIVMLRDVMPTHPKVKS